MFNATAKTLRNAADRRFDDGDVAVLDAPISGIEPLAYEDLDAPVASLPVEEIGGIDADELRKLHAEYRWVESTLMQASERLVEAQEARRKDLVALEGMRRELRRSYAAERSYIEGQLRWIRNALPHLWSRERDLAEIVEGGMPTAPLVQELASTRAERKLYEIAAAQAQAQHARIDQDEATLEFEVANEAFATEVTGATMTELARLRTAKTRTARAATQLRRESNELFDSLGIDTGMGEVAAIAAFISAEVEGDARAHERMTRVREGQILRELEHLPEPASGWKAALRPISWAKARRFS